MAELSLADMAAVWRRDLVTNVIPFWEKHSLDREHGGYFTCCDRDGKILDDSKYMWLQARAVFMWSRLYNECREAALKDHSLFLIGDRWFEAAKLGANFLKHGKDADGRLYFAVSRDGATPLHFQRKQEIKASFMESRALVHLPATALHPTPVARHTFTRSHVIAWRWARWQRWRSFREALEWGALEWRRCNGARWNGGKEALGWSSWAGAGQPAKPRSPDCVIAPHAASVLVEW